MQQFVTIGLAGHIDHGKTALTKALTGMETDRLKEELERQITIENGFAYFDIGHSQRAAIIDVPGHEKFIRQMIAGVAGIDLVLIVVAADEGIMPQTKEHLTILRFLNITEAIVVITKTDLVDEDWLMLVREDISDELGERGYGDAPVFEVDSLTNRGMTELKQKIIDVSQTLQPKNSHEPFRLPIDDVFTLHGQGTIVRGTIFNGSVSDADDLLLLPQQQFVRVRQLQVHHEKKTKAFASQRVAINLAGLNANQIHRGDVLVSSDIYKPTQRIDVYLETTSDLKYILKQRTQVMCHLGTAAVMGKLILFDRNQLNENEAVYCQIELTKPIITKRDDRFVIRRPSPVETIGGGWVIDVNAEKHRFGTVTTDAIGDKANGTLEERIGKLLRHYQVMSYQSLMLEVNLDKDMFEQYFTSLKEQGDIIILANGDLIDRDLLRATKESLRAKLQKFHKQHPLKWGMNKAEWLKEATWHDLLVKEAGKQLEREDQVETDGYLIQVKYFSPSFPTAWAKRMSSIINELMSQGLTVGTWPSICDQNQLPNNLQEELKQYLLRQKIAYLYGDNSLVHIESFEQSIQLLHKHTSNQFSIKEAKDILGISRKYMIPYLELCDKLGYTRRQEDVRVWTN